MFRHPEEKGVSIEISTKNNSDGAGRHLAEAQRPWLARCVATRLTDGAGRPLVRHYPSPDAPSRATVPTAAARASNGRFQWATGPSAVGPRHALLGLAPERRCGRRRHAYAAHHRPQLRHKDASVVETRWVEARWLQRLHCVLRTFHFCLRPRRRAKFLRARLHGRSRQPAAHPRASD